MIEEKVRVGVGQLVEEENALLSKKESLLAIMENLENRLSSEIRRRQSSISLLRAEVSELEKKCEVLANALEIPVLK